ncbi:hypothetical protein ACFE04_026725 [Oxalis oulophora]
MGGKGQRRREKNYKAAHGDSNRLPPPPDKKPDTLPSKLRAILAYTSPTPPPHQELANASNDSQGKNNKRKRDDDVTNGKKKQPIEDDIRKAESKDEEDSTLIKEGSEDDNEIGYEDGTNNNKKKKKKSRKHVDDLRFQELTKGASTKRKDRKKKYLEAKKNKKKAKTERDDLDFPGHENIRFGDVVQAPPKLVKVPKAIKTIANASQERIRLQTIENYRNRKGWTSRPGLQLPSIMSTTPTM